MTSVNDILSVKKELVLYTAFDPLNKMQLIVLYQMQGQVNSLIPLLYVQNGSLNAAMDDAMGILIKAIADFEHSTQSLLDQYPDNIPVHSELQKFIHGCRCACTANLNWRSVLLIDRLGVKTNFMHQSSIGKIPTR